MVIMRCWLARTGKNWRLCFATYASALAIRSSMCLRCFACYTWELNCRLVSIHKGRVARLAHVCDLKLQESAYHMWALSCFLSNYIVVGERSRA